LLNRNHFEEDNSAGWWHGVVVTRFS